MDKKFSAAFVTMLFILGIFAVPVSAHFTVGQETGSYPYRLRNFDPHVAGLQGYVFPGSGLFASGAPGWYTGSGTYPGYQSPWPYRTGAVQNPFPVQGPAGWYQLDANNYAPFGAIMTSSVAGTKFNTMWLANKAPNDNPTIEGLDIVQPDSRGDLILAINMTATFKEFLRLQNPGILAINFTMWETMLPPEFTNYNRRNVVTSVTNNYDLITTSKRNREDFSYGPGWTRLRIYADTEAFSGSDVVTFDKMDDAPDSFIQPNTGNPLGSNAGLAYSPWKTFGNITFSLQQADQTGLPYPDEWYYARINNVVAPTIAGAYMFKFRRLICPDNLITNVLRPGVAQGWGHSVYWAPENWPVVLVKGEVDPGIITGTIRYGGWNTTMYGLPVTLPGRVRAVGIADDPNAPTKPTGRLVEARGYFNETALGHYEVEGVAPGTYDIYASAAGYPEIKIAQGIKILKGQSYHVDGYLTPGVQIRGTVFSKCGTGEVPWFQTGADRNIKIEIYRQIGPDGKVVGDAESMLPGGSTSKAVTWSPIGNDAANWGLYSFKYTFMGTPAASGTWIGGWKEGGTNDVVGVGPPPNQGLGWAVSNGLANFNFQFGREGYYGAPAEMTGHIPFDWRLSSRNGATWVSGVGAGTYSVRAWLFGYVQTQIDGVTFMPVIFTVSGVEWPGNVYVVFDLRLSSFVSKTVHFHDVPGTLVENPIAWGWSYEQVSTHPLAPAYGYFRYLAAELTSADASNYQSSNPVRGNGAFNSNPNVPTGQNIQAWNLDPVPIWRRSYTIVLRGFNELGLWYGWGRNYGIPSGTYTARAYMWGYVEQQFEQVSLGLCGTNVTLSDHLYRGARFNITLYSRDWQHPTADKYWTYPGAPIYIQIQNVDKAMFLGPRWDYTVNPLSMQGAFNRSVTVWPYMYNNPRYTFSNHAGLAVFGPDHYQVIYGNEYYHAWDPVNPSYYTDYFGPSRTYNGSLYPDFRYYDGSENYMYTYYFPSSTYGHGATIGAYPYSFESGTYSFKALTYGYVQKRDVMVWASKGNVTSDIMIPLAQGVELQASIQFKHESVYEGIPFDAHMRIRVLDDNNKLVGEYLTSDWAWQPQFYWDPTNPNPVNLRWNWNLLRTTPQNPVAPLAAPNALARAMPYGHQNYWRLNYIPAGTKQARVVIAGLPDMYGWLGDLSCDPCGSTGDYGWENNPLPAPYGIDGYSINDPTSYKGNWHIQVHIVPIYRFYPGHPMALSTTEWRVFGYGAGYATDPGVTPITPVPYGTTGVPAWVQAPAVGVGVATGFEGMLMGELTYKTDLTPNPENHLGPYELRTDVNFPNTHLGGEASAVFELDRLGLVSGTVVGYTYVDDWRTVSWAQVKFTPAAGPFAATGLTFYSSDGRFAAWLPGDVNPPNTPYTYAAKRTVGPYRVSVTVPGYKPTPAMAVAVSDGAFSTFNTYLEKSNIPIPEFPAAAIALASALAASLFILRRRRK